MANISGLRSSVLMYGAHSCHILCGRPHSFGTPNITSFHPNIHRLRVIPT